MPGSESKKKGTFGHGIKNPFTFVDITTTMPCHTKIRAHATLCVHCVKLQQTSFFPPLHQTALFESLLVPLVSMSAVATFPQGVYNAGTVLRTALANVKTFATR